MKTRSFRSRETDLMAISLPDARELSDEVLAHISQMARGFRHEICAKTLENPALLQNSPKTQDSEDG
jgi:hypothetical protein